MLLDKIGVVGFPEMPVTDVEVRDWKAGPKRQNKSVGNSLYVVIEAENRSGTKSFEGRMRFNGKQIPVRIGVYGKGAGKFSLLEARREWERLKSWSYKNGRDPREKIKEEKKELIRKSSGPNLREGVDIYFRFLEEKGVNTESTIKDKKNKFSNQIIPELGATTPVKSLGWDMKSKGRTGREAIISILDSIENRGSKDQARKVAGAMRQFFDFAIERGWMERDQNPASNTKNVGLGHEVEHYPCLSWNELPELLHDLNTNRGKGSLVVVNAIKLDLMTFLRVGSLVGMRWDELDYAANLWTVPAKRMKSGSDHLVPLTEPIKDLFAHLRKLNGDKEHVFWSPRGKKKPHIDESALNQHLKERLGYGGRQTAHGLRSLPLTAGQDVLKFPAEVIQRQMDHAVGNKVRQAYDRSQMLDERWDFMRAWCDALINQGLQI